MKAVIKDKWILCPSCQSKTRTQVLEDTEMKNFPLYCPKCKKSFIINVKNNAKFMKNVATRSLNLT